jgi:predicted Zn-ribbon and HTH transcriptional regulator
MKFSKLSRFTRISLAVSGVLLLAWLGLTLFADSPSQKTDAVVKDPTRCPNCGRPLPRASIRTKECPYCLIERGPEAAKFGDAPSSTGSKAIAYGLVGTVVLLLLANLAIAVHGWRRRRKIETVFHYACPKCGRRLRYRESQIGRPARCPLCERPVVFPKPAGLGETRWMRLRRWLYVAPEAAGRES